MNRWYDRPESIGKVRIDSTGREFRLISVEQTKVDVGVMGRTKRIRIHTNDEALQHDIFLVEDTETGVVYARTRDVMEKLYALVKRPREQDDEQG